MDPRSDWALGEFRDARIELLLLEHDATARCSRINNAEPAAPAQAPAASFDRRTGSSAHRARLASSSRRIAYQGERLAGLLVVKFEAGSGGDEQRSRWRRFGDELSVELEITTEAVASAGSAFVSEEPSLWRDYEGRENARDRGVLTRSNRIVQLDVGTLATAKDSGDLVYALDVQVQVPVDYLGQAVVLDALVTPASRSQRESTIAASATEIADNTDSNGGRGERRGRRRGAGGDFATRLDGLFALSRVTPMRLPVKRCPLPLRVVQPIAVTSRCSSSSSSTSSSGVTGATAASSAGSIGRCLVALEVRNDHPVSKVTVHDVEVHVDATARSGERASSTSLGFSVPGKAGGGGGGGKGAARRRRKMSAGGGGSGGGSSAPLEGLEGSIEQPQPVGVGNAGNFSRVFCASWVAKPSLPLTLAPGEVQGFVLSIAPDVEPLPPRRASGSFESPITFVWTLDNNNGTDTVGSASPASTSPKLRSASSPSPPPPPLTVQPTTSVHLAQWHVEQRDRDEVLVRVKGQPRVKLNRVFEVSLRVRNLSPGARDLVVMFTENVSEKRPLSLEGIVRLGGGSGSVGGRGGGLGSDTDGDAQDISPATSPIPRSGGRSTSGDFQAHDGAPPPRPPRPAGNAGAAHATAPTSLGDLLPIDAAVPLGVLERGAERGATVRLTAARTGLARLSSLCLRDNLTGAVYAPAYPYEVFVEG